MPSAGTSCYETASSGSGAFMCMQFDKSMHAGSNPFPVGDPRQLLWADAANRAEERIARLIKDFTFTEATDVSPQRRGSVSWQSLSWTSCRKSVCPF